MKLLGEGSSSLDAQSSFLSMQLLCFRANEFWLAVANSTAETLNLLLPANFLEAWVSVLHTFNPS